MTLPCPRTRLRVALLAALVVGSLAPAAAASPGSDLPAWLEAPPSPAAVEPAAPVDLPPAGRPMLLPRQAVHVAPAAGAWSVRLDGAGAAEGSGHVGALAVTWSLAAPEGPRHAVRDASGPMTYTVRGNATIPLLVTNPEDATLDVVPWVRIERFEPGGVGAVREFRLTADTIVAGGPRMTLQPNATRVMLLQVGLDEGPRDARAFRFTVLGHAAGHAEPVRLSKELTLLVPALDSSAAHASLTRAASSLLEAFSLLLLTTGATATVLWAAASARRDELKALALAPLVGLFTRLHRHDVLSHETRDRIVAAVRETPGIPYSDLRSMLGLAPGVMLHHLSVLHQHQVLVSRKVDGRRRYYLTGTRVPDAPPSPVRGTQARVLELATREALPQATIAQRLGVTQQAVSYHLRALARKGLLPARGEPGGGPPRA